MTRNRICLLAVCGLAASAWAKPKAEREPSPDVPRGPGADNVGDVDSFGRNVLYLGAIQTAQVELTTDCTPDPSAPPLPNDRCIVVAAAPGTTIVEQSELAKMVLPAKSTRSLICFVETPFINFQFNNTSGTFQPSAAFNLRPTVRIESGVLDDPSLVDKTTGLPFGGAIKLTLGTYGENRSLAPGERAQKQLTMTRACVAGLISKSALTQTYGLSEALAKEFFKKPITLRFGASGQTRFVDFATYFYGVRLFGD